MLFLVKKNEDYNFIFKEKFNKIINTSFNARTLVKLVCFGKEKISLKKQSNLMQISPLLKDCFKHNGHNTYTMFIHI
jgi:hypothetical protein